MSDHCIFSKLYPSYPSNPTVCTLSQEVYLLECTGTKAEQDDCPFWYRPMGTIEPNKIDMRPEAPRVVKRKSKNPGDYTSCGTLMD